MGMFNWVDYETVCPICHSKIDGFQTKDGETKQIKVSVKDVSNFYTFCKCGIWIEFNEIEDSKYERIIKKKNCCSKILSKYTKLIKIKG